MCGKIADIWAMIRENIWYAYSSIFNQKNTKGRMEDSSKSYTAGSQSQLM